MENIKLKPEAIRMNLAMNQEDFCKAIGISTRVYNTRLNKKTEWKASELTKMAELAKIKIDDIEI